MPGDDDRGRLFVALELPDNVRAALARWGGGLGIADPSLRGVPAESLHITLCFLGDRPLAEVDAIARACAGVAGPPAPELSLGPALHLPPRRPRVIAVRIEDRSRRLEHLQGALAAELAALGVFEPETRPFLPHVTVARVRGTGRGGARGRTPPRLVSAMPFTATALTLFRSQPVFGGIVYEPLASAFLDGPGSA